jgi:DNA-binding transcriptional MerR regulator
MGETRHHSIGEVLSMLKDEHADVTISKIRFFESQGLIAPERTASGYRKFYDHDIDRLRWILVQQRDHFLPLKVIKRRMEEDGFDPTAEVPPPADGPLPEPTLFSREEAADDPDAGDVSEPEAESETVDSETAEDATSDGADAEALDEAPPAAAEEEPEVEPAPVDDAADGVEADEVDDGAADEPEADEPEDEPDPGPEPAEVPPAPPIAEGDPLDMPAGSVSLSALELAESAGTDLGLVADLERLGLIQTVAGGSGTTYDHEALVVAKAAAVFRARGVEPRHLRMFKIAADREAGVLAQLVTARLKKGGETQQVARAELNELVNLGEVIHRSILRRGFGDQLD